MPLPAGRVITAQERSRYPSFSARPHTFPALLLKQAELRPDDIALIAPDRTVTYAEWVSASASAAGQLRRLGVTDGSRVGIWLGNEDGGAWSIVTLAIQWAGAIPVPMSNRLALPEVLRGLEGVAASHVIVPRASADVSTAKTRVVSMEELLNADPSGQLVTPLCSEDDVAGIFHTSGTTGEPKAAMLSHACFAYIAAMTEDLILGEPAGVSALGPHDVIQTSVPLYTTTGLMHFIVVGLYSGCRLVIEERFDVDDTITAMLTHRSTIWLAVPSMMVLIGDRFAEPIEGSAMRAIIHMGSVATPAAISEITRVLPGVATLNLYSLTETGAGIVSCSREEGVKYPGTVGQAVPSCRLRVVAPDGSDCGAGQHGEIWFDSPYMFDGYFGNQEASKSAFSPDGWLRTGDGGWFDDDGRLWVSGRLGDVIVRGGFKINPVAVERALTSYPGILDACVVPVPHRVLGQDSVGVVVTTKALKTDEVRAHCRGQLAEWEIPRVLIEVDELPRNSFGKLDRRTIRRLAEERYQAGKRSSDDSR